MTRLESLITNLRKLSGALAIAVVVSRTSFAQALNRKEPPSVLTGVAIDSIDGGFLAGASIVVWGTGLSAKTDAGGQFRIEGIPAGPHVIEIHHPLIDSLAIVITTTAKIFSPGDSSFVMVGVPSAATLVRSTCSEADVAKGPAFVVGTVTDGDTGEPAAGAVVTIAWADYDIGKKSIKVTPQHREATVSKLGRFRACGLPDDLVASVSASRGSDTTAVLKADLTSLIGILSFRLPPQRVTSPGVAGLPAAAMTTMSVYGRVVDGSGKPASGAEVSVESDGVKATTREDGAFSLGGVRPGTRSVTIRKIGYEPVRRTVELRRNDATKIVILLGRSVTLLKDLIVKANRVAALEQIGFSRRKKTANGTFLGPEQLRFSDPYRLESVLRAVPLLKRGNGVGVDDACVKYFVDGFRVAPGIDPQEYLGGSEIGAVEVYSPYSVPGEFQAVSDRGVPCKAVIIWTKWKIGLR